MKKIVAVLVLISFLGFVLQPFTFTFKAVAQERTPSYKRGRRDGRQAANKDTKSIWSLLDFTYGFTLGPIAVGHSLVSDYALNATDLPDKRKRQISKRNQDYRKGYKRGYIETKNRNKLAIRATGWISWIGTWAVLEQMRE